MAQHINTKIGSRRGRRRRCRPTKWHQDRFWNGWDIKFKNFTDLTGSANQRKHTATTLTIMTQSDVQEPGLVCAEQPSHSLRHSVWITPNEPPFHPVPSLLLLLLNHAERAPLSSCSLTPPTPPESRRTSPPFILFPHSSYSSWITPNEPPFYPVPSLLLILLNHAERAPLVSCSLTPPTPPESRRTSPPCILFPHSSYSS